MVAVGSIVIKTFLGAISCSIIGAYSILILVVSKGVFPWNGRASFGALCNIYIKRYFYGVKPLKYAISLKNIRQMYWSQIKYSETGLPEDLKAPKAMLCFVKLPALYILNCVETKNTYKK
jgi:hypothetical protein